MTKSFILFISLLAFSNFSFGIISKGANTELFSFDTYQHDLYHISTSINCSSAQLASQKGSVGYNSNRSLDNSSVLILKNNFPYLLPFSKGVKIQVKKSCYIGSEIKSGLPNNWMSYQFLTEEEEPVLASRRGVVIDVQDVYFSDSTLYIRFENQQNYVLVKHLDGTIACYMGLNKGSVKVQKGQEVTPHMQLGLTASFNRKEKNQLCFILFYSNVKEAHKLNNQKYSFLNPVFYTSKGKEILELDRCYHSGCDDVIIMQEFSRREKKKYIKGGLN